MTWDEIDAFGVMAGWEQCWMCDHRVESWRLPDGYVVTMWHITCSLLAGYLHRQDFIVRDPPDEIVNYVLKQLEEELAENVAVRVE
jgi:hypothetical protein